MIYLKRSISVVVIFKYRRTPVSVGNTFQDLPRLHETADNTERYIQGVPGGMKYFGRVFLELNYTDITQNTYIQS